MSEAIQQRIVAEIQRRADVLPAELELWRAETQGNLEGMGIHRTQVQAIQLMFDTMHEQIRALLAELDSALPTEAFIAKRDAVERKLTLVHGFLAFFRLTFGQRRESEEQRRYLDTADLAAAGCYRPCIEQAQAWGLIQPEQFREPPLTALIARSTPVAATRRTSFSQVGLPLDDVKDDYSRLKLPISLIGLPYHHLPAIWLWCSIYHEVGHPLDQDLDLRGKLRPAVDKRLEEAGSPEARRTAWSFWMAELVADAVGVLLGRDAFAHDMAGVLFLPKQEVLEINAGGAHPGHYVRMFLLAALLRRIDSAGLASAAGELEELWRTLYAPDTQGENAEALQSFVNECDTVAAALLDSPLDDDPTHTLAALVTPATIDPALLKQLARYFQIGFQRPTPKSEMTRAIPAAARLAAQQVKDNHATVFQAIQTRALEFAEAIPRPEFLSVGPEKLSDARAEYLRRLVLDL